MADTYSIRSEIIATIEFKIYSKKILHLTYLPTTKIRQFLEQSYKKQLTRHPLITKDRGIFVILHTREDVRATGTYLIFLPSSNDVIYYIRPKI